MPRGKKKRLRCRDKLALHGNLDLELGGSVHWYAASVRGLSIRQARSLAFGGSTGWLAAVIDNLWQPKAGAWWVS